MTPKTEHRWSGWPGAYCMVCGIEDPREACVANHPDGCQMTHCQETYCPGVMLGPVIYNQYPGNRVGIPHYHKNATDYPCLSAHGRYP